MMNWQQSERDEQHSCRGLQEVALQCRVLQVCPPKLTKKNGSVQLKISAPKF
jgi:hypothetical protein